MKGPHSFYQIHIDRALGVMRPGRGHGSKNDGRQRGSYRHMHANDWINPTNG